MDKTRSLFSAAEIISKTRDLISPRKNNFVVNLGRGSFEWDPEFLNYFESISHPIFGRQYGNDSLDCPEGFRELLELANWELARIRQSDWNPSHQYHSSTHLPFFTELSSEADDIKIVGSLMQQFPNNYIFTGDYITQFGEDHFCHYEKLIELKGVSETNLQKSLEESLILRTPDPKLMRHQVSRLRELHKSSKEQTSKVLVIS